MYNPIVYFLAVRRFRQDAKHALFQCIGQTREKEDSSGIGNGQTFTLMTTQSTPVSIRSQLKYERQDSKLEVTNSKSGSLKSLLRTGIQTGRKTDKSKCPTPNVGGKYNNGKEYVLIIDRDRNLVKEVDPEEI